MLSHHFQTVGVGEFPESFLHQIRQVQIDGSCVYAVQIVVTKKKNIESFEISEHY